MVTPLPAVPAPLGAIGARTGVRRPRPEGRDGCREGCAAVPDEGPEWFPCVTVATPVLIGS
jgi:hypothetical protein